VKHNGIQQGWIIFDSAAARVSLQPTMAKQVLKEMTVAKKIILHLCAR
jgi:hypothetical protein